MGTTGLGTKLAAMRKNTDDADVTLKCQGQIVKTHSFILRMWYGILNLFSNKN